MSIKINNIDFIKLYIFRKKEKKYIKLNNIIITFNIIINNNKIINFLLKEILI